jgi:hypothetical protein
MLLEFGGGRRLNQPKPRKLPPHNKENALDLPTGHKMKSTSLAATR